jgi:hypothetical protein
MSVENKLDIVITEIQELKKVMVDQTHVLENIVDIFT